MMGIDLKPLERGMDALVRMADALESIARSGAQVSFSFRDAAEAASVAELRLAALAHAIECYEGPDDDTLPVLRHWMNEMEAQDE